MKRLLRFSALLGVCSVSLNTRKTFELYPLLRPVWLRIFVTDSAVIIALLFTAESVTKFRSQTCGLLTRVVFAGDFLPIMFLVSAWT